MPVGLMMDFESMTLADYDALCTKINFPAAWPEGLLAHTSSEVDGHLRVTDVWETRDHFDDFIANTLAEAMEEGSEPPEVLERRLHSFYARERVSA